jgi:hypothetical protein
LIEGALVKPGREEGGIQAVDGGSIGVGRFPFKIFEVLAISQINSLIRGVSSVHA